MARVIVGRRVNVGDRRDVVGVVDGRLATPTWFMLMNGNIVSMSLIVGAPEYGRFVQPAGPVASPLKRIAPFVCEWARLIAWPNSCVITPANRVPVGSPTR